MLKEWHNAFWKSGWCGRHLRECSATNGRCHSGSRKASAGVFLSTKRVRRRGFAHFWGERVHCAGGSKPPRPQLREGVPPAERRGEELRRIGQGFVFSPR